MTLWATDEYLIGQFAAGSGKKAGEFLHALSRFPAFCPASPHRQPGA